MRQIVALAVSFALAPGAVTPAAAQPSTPSSTMDFQQTLDDISTTDYQLQTQCRVGPEATIPQCQKQQYIVSIQQEYIASYHGNPALAKYQIHRPKPGSSYWAISAYPQVAEKIQLLDGIESVERNHQITSLEAEPPWGLDRINSPSGFDGVFEPASSAEGVYIYIVDTGISEHAEFGDRLVPGFSAFQDEHGTLDCNGHGTHVASTAVGETLGVARSATVVPVRVLDCTGNATAYQLLQALEWVQSHTATHDSPAIINLSLGGGRTPSLDSIFTELIGDDIAVVGAIGNTGEFSCRNGLLTQSPKSILVGASNEDDQFSFISSHGYCMDIIAPGVYINGASNTGPNDEVTKTGTSMATPHVTGVLATLLTGQDREATYPIINNLLQGATQDVIANVPQDTRNRFLYSPSPEELLLFQTLPPEDDTSSRKGSEKAGPGETADNITLTVQRRIQGNTVHLDWRFSDFPENATAQSIVLETAESATEPQGISLPVGTRSYSFILTPDSPPRVATIVLYDNDGNVVFRSMEIKVSLDSPKSVRKPPIKAPHAGTLDTWTKRVSENQVKFYAKYPQIGEKIQFMVQDDSGTYQELAWLRIEPEDVTPEGLYPPDVLTNGIYFVRTLALEPGKNRLRILVNGELVDRTITYVR